MPNISKIIAARIAPAIRSDIMKTTRNIPLTKGHNYAQRTMSHISS